ncbi:MAG: CTP:molybdopterin cytidylyltransferase MocA [Planctomycetota bacterium]|jgi:CTP:molybdopterin cytidylyltransferase MocA
MKPTLVVLAAGESRRLGRCKAIEVFDGCPAIVRLLEAARAWTASSPIVVTGPDHDVISAVLPSGCRIVRNEAWKLGRSGSLAAAVRAHPDADLMLAPVDVPLVPELVFAALAREWIALGSPERGWLAPALRRELALNLDLAHQGSGRPLLFGHPILIGRELACQVSALPADAPLWKLRERAEPLAGLEVDAPEILDDIDEESDVIRIRKRLRESR